MEHCEAEKPSSCRDHLPSLSGVCHAWTSNHTQAVSQCRVCIFQRSIWRPITLQRHTKAVPSGAPQIQPTNAAFFPPFWRMHRCDLSWPHISQESLRSQKRRKKEIMATLSGEDLVFKYKYWVYTRSLLILKSNARYIKLPRTFKPQNVS